MAHKTYQTLLDPSFPVYARYQKRSLLSSLGLACEANVVSTLSLFQHALVVCT